ncbi:HEAT repeat domain-containing protein [Niveispirillum sp. SYP-B3756]|uniref:HEAT repeat domain-containing protein n=1 Tax=Niveispirillum sp. SYP-B3756 TaxID=2662178 RepID=UPI001565F31A|nr:HEAT repeat domain-containing protein [Niveispirillum sp. SYP-B3756]
MKESLSAIINRIQDKLIPEIQDFIEECKKRIDPTSPDSCFDCIDIVRGIIDSGALSRQVNAYLLTMMDGGSRESFVSDGTMLLYFQGGFSVTVTKIQRRPAHIYLHPTHLLGSSIGRNTIRLHRYNVDPIPDNHVFSPEHRVIKTQCVDLERGDVFMRNGHHECLDYEAVDGKPALLFRLISTNVGALEWAFDRDSGRPWNVMAVNPVSSKLCSVMNVLAALGSSTSVEPLDALTNHPDHFVRWKALQTIAEISPETAASIIGRFEDDPHPHVRAAARKTIENMKVA